MTRLHFTYVFHRERKKREKIRNMETKKRKRGRTGKRKARQSKIDAIRKDIE